MREGLRIAKKGNRPLNPFQFNAFAIIIILVVYPFAIGFVSGLGAVAGEDVETSHNTYGEMPNEGPYAWWVNNGNVNMTYHYDSYPVTAYRPCAAYIVDSYGCDGIFGGFSNIAGPPLSNALLFPHSYELYQTHHYASLDQTQNGTNFQIPYVGTSGDGDFELSLSPYFLNEVENFEAVDVLKFDYVDTSNSYHCDNHNWVDLTIKGSIEFEFENETISFDGFLAETTNRYVHYPIYNNFAKTCNVGFSFEFDFDSFESLQLLEFNDGFYNLTRTNVSIDKITRDDGLRLSNTELPFAGIDSFHLLVQHSTVDVTQANFFLKTGTLVLTVLTFLLAIGSTPYWDPVMQSFRGRL